MRKLLRANLTRLKKDKIFHLTLLALLVIVALVLYSCVSMSRTEWAESFEEEFPEEDYMEEYIPTSFEEKYFNSLPFAGFVLLVPISIFLGTEMSDGGIRKKLSVGHTKAGVYFSDFLTSLVIVCVLFLIWLLGAVIGARLCGLGELEKTEFVRYLAVSFFSMLPLAAVFTLIGQLTDHKAMPVVISMVLTLLLIILSAWICNTLAEPERITYYEITAEGMNLVEDVENPSYVGGTQRVILTGLEMLLPVCHQIRICSMWSSIVTVREAVLMIADAIALTAVLNAVGILLFRRKDLK